MYKALSLLMLSTVALGSSAMAADTSAKVKTSIEREDDGGYTRKDEKVSVDSQGTKVSETKKTKLSIDKDGDAEKTVEVKKTVDPKGLLNKTTEKSKDVVKEEQDNEDYDKTVKSEVTTKDGTTQKASDKVSVSVDSDGSAKSKHVKEYSNDPKGLMNKTSTETKDSMKRDEDGDTKVEHKKEVNGTTTEKSKW